MDFKNIIIKGIEKYLIHLVFLALSAIGLFIYTDFNTLCYVPSVWFDWICTSFTLPLWALILIFISCPLIFYILAFVHNLTQKNSDISSKIDHLKYHSDFLKGISWKWFYNSNGSIKQILPMCPKCGCQLVSENQRDWVYDTLTVHFRCPQCNFSNSMQGTYYDVENDVTLIIQNNIRNGTWKKPEN